MAIGPSVAVDTWGGMAKRVAKDMLLLVIGEGTLVPHGLPGGRSVVLPHKQLGKIGNLTPPLQWPPFLGPPFCPYEFAARYGHVLCRQSLPS